MSSNLTDKFISNTYTKIFQKSELPDSEGSENINLDLGLNNDSLTLVNGLGQKIKSFILDVGNPAGATMGYGIYFQTDSMKSSGDFGLRLSSINERGQITSQNKDILISTDNSTTGDILEGKRRLILKGGIPGTMSFTNTDLGIVGDPVGTQSQITLLLQGRVSVEHGYPIYLNNFQTQELGLMSGFFKGEGPEEIQIWTKVGNVVKVSGSWRWNPSGIAAGPSEVPMYTTMNPINLPGTVTNYIFPVFVPGSLVSYDTSTGVFTFLSAGSYTISGSIWVRYKRIGPPNSLSGYIEPFTVEDLRPNINIEYNSSANIFFYRLAAPPPPSTPPITPLTPVPVSSPSGTLSGWFELPFSHNRSFAASDTFELKYSIDTSGFILNWHTLTSQFEVEFGNNSYVKVNGATAATMGNGSTSTINPYSTDLRFPIVNGSSINRVFGVAKFRNEPPNNSGYVKENVVVDNRPNSASFYKANVLNASSGGPVDFSYSYILEF